MIAVNDIVEKLSPAVADLVDYLEQSCQPQALAFFQQVQHRLSHVDEEEQLLELFLMLSMTAFKAFQMDPMGSLMADRILAYAEQIAHTLSASEDRTH